jgi:CheY-like chemotaxis protein
MEAKSLPRPQGREQTEFSGQRWRWPEEGDMSKILIVDDDEAMRGLLRTRLESSYEVLDTGDPDEALGMALEHKPDAVLLDLIMPKFSGFDLCQSLRSLSYTSRIRVFVITGKGGDEAQEYCKNLGAVGFFQKPVDFNLLKRRLAEELEAQRPERRSETRVRMRVTLKLRGTDTASKPFEEITTTENVSAGGFLCNCSASLATGTMVEVFLVSGMERYVGLARVMRKESSDISWQRYGFHLESKEGQWVLQA